MKKAERGSWLRWDKINPHHRVSLVYPAQDTHALLTTMPSVDRSDISMSVVI